MSKSNPEYKVLKTNPTVELMLTHPLLYNIYNMVNKANITSQDVKEYYKDLGYEGEALNNKIYNLIGSLRKTHIVLDTIEDLCNICHKDIIFIDDED